MANIEIRRESPSAFYIKVHETDNVAIIVMTYGLKAGTRFPDGTELTGLYSRKAAKVALTDIPAHGEMSVMAKSSVMRYATSRAEAGSTVAG